MRSFYRGWTCPRFGSQNEYGEPENPAVIEEKKAYASIVRDIPIHRNYVDTARLLLTSWIDFDWRRYHGWLLGKAEDDHTTR